MEPSNTVKLLSEASRWNQLVDDRWTADVCPWSGNDTLSERWSIFEQGTDPLNFPVILDPSYHKYPDPVYDLLQPQWETLAAELSTAERIIVIGYSLPEGDTRERSVISSSLQANPSAKWLLIDPSESTADRYKKLIGNQQLTWIQDRLA
jgi:hypothetical protein